MISGRNYFFEGTLVPPTPSHSLLVVISFNGATLQLMEGCTRGQSLKLLIHLVVSCREAVLQTGGCGLCVKGEWVCVVLDGHHRQQESKWEVALMW